MSVSRKVFILNGPKFQKSVSQESADDLMDLIRTHSNIFAEKPDIVFSDFDFNADGLKCPTFIVPGGCTGYLGNYVRPLFDIKHQDTLGQNYNYIGICAGAMVGSANADIFLANADFDREGFEARSPKMHYGTYTRKNSCVGAVEVSAIGTFYPVDAPVESKKTITPYKVNLNLTGDDSTSRQLFAGGCGFDPKTINAEEVDVVATYADRKEYPFFFSGKKREAFSPFPAIVRQKPSGERGGRVLSGTHFETCVPDSRLLRFFAQPSKDADALSREDDGDLKLASTETLAFVKDLLKTSLK